MLPEADSGYVANRGTAGGKRWSGGRSRLTAFLRGPARRSAPGVRTDARHAAQAVRTHRGLRKDAAPCRPGPLFARSAPLRGPARRSAPGVRTGARHAAQTARAHPWADSRAKHPCFALPRSPAARTRLVAASGSVLREQVLCCPNEVESLTDQWGVPGRGIAESSAWMRCGGESAMGERAPLARHAARVRERPARCAGPDRGAG